MFGVNAWKLWSEENVLVATDDVRIMEHCNQNQMNVMMTSSECLTGTDRLAEVAVKFKKKILY